MNNLKYLRFRLNISLRKLDEYTHVAYTTLARLEKGERSFRLEHINALCDFFKVSSDFLLGKSDYGIIVELKNSFAVISKSDYENLISSTGDMKLWWPHSEMLYLYRKLYVLTKDKDFDNYYKMAFDYSFSTFPSTNNGEWVQIRDRRGKPVDKVVALPVKDPFHIMRDFLKIIKLEEK